MRFIYRNNNILSEKDLGKSNKVNYKFLKNYRLLAITLFIGTLISFISFKTILYNNERKLSESFHASSKVKTLIFKKELESYIEELELLAGLYASDVERHTERFAALMKFILQKRQFNSINWLRADGVNNDLFITVEHHVAKKKFSASEIGQKNFDNKIKAEIYKGIFREKPIATSLFSYFSPDESEIALIMPVVKHKAIDINKSGVHNQHLYKAIKGLLVGVLDLEEFFEVALDWKSYNAHDAEIYIYDDTDHKNSQWIYYSDGTTSKFPGRAFGEDTAKSLIIKNLPFYHIETVILLSRKWTLVFVPTKEFRSEVVNDLAPWIILLCGISITMLVGAFLYYLINRSKKIEVLVSQRTEELEFTTQILEDNQNRLQAVLSTVIDGILTVDTAGYIRATNPAAEKLFGYSSDELVGSHVKNLVPPSRMLEYSYYMQYLLSNSLEKMKEIGEIEALRKGGEIFSMEIGISTVKINKETMLVAILRDITERKNTESRLASYASALEMERNKAEAASKAKSQFLANMSHEIRTPMNSIIGMTELLLGTRLTLEQHEYLKTIHSSGEMLLAIINDILDLSKIEAGEAQISNTKISLYKLVAEIVQLLTPRARENNTEVLVRFSPYIPTLITDQIKLRQIIINLLSNAIKFSKDNYVLLNFSTEIINDKFLRISFEIIDQGIGIPHDKLEKIFDNFTQADESTTRKYGGTGLGLSICKRLVNMMGGKIGVISQIDKGSTFWTKIPAEYIIEDDSSELVEASDSLRNKRVLVIDSIPESRRIISEYLDYLSIPYKAVETGAEGLELLHQTHQTKEQFSFILVDYLIKDMDWVKFGSIIRDEPKFAYLKMILIVCFDKLVHYTTIENSGFYSYLVKPVYADNLLNALKESAFNIVLGSRLEAKEVKKHSDLLRFNAHILVVEDYPPNQRLIKKMLEKFGCNIDIATGGEEALEILSKSNYDLIFMDCQMPNMDGYETTEAIRKMELDKHITIVAMTANVLAGDREKCLAAGMDDYVGKPLKQKDLSDVLTKWLPQCEEKI